jgi:2-polyprenyl-6-methoxyphenol hydroxylase-like FAD-dependent oxidoreductase
MMGRELAATVRGARFVSEPIGYRFPHSQRRRYELMQSFPEGLLAIGDSICSFNPIYGQGMTVAACEALALRDCLAAGEDRLATRFFGRAARIVDVAWDLAVGADLAMDCVQGERSAATRFINAYIARVFRAAQHDPVVARAFLDVAHLLARPPSLMRPAIVARVFATLWRRRKDSKRLVGRGSPAAAA